MMPLDKTPVPDGNIEVRDGTAVYLTTELIQDRNAEAFNQGKPALLFYKSHFATCPQSTGWRKKKK